MRVGGGANRKLLNPLGLSINNLEMLFKGTLRAYLVSLFPASCLLKYNKVLVSRDIRGYLRPWH